MILRYHSVMAYPETPQEAKALLEFYRQSDAEIPWYAVVYIPPEFKEKHPKIYQALEAGFRELMANKELSQTLFRRILNDPTHQKPIPIVSTEDHPSLEGLGSVSPMAYIGPEKKLPKEVQRSLVVGPTLFNMLFVEKSSPEFVQLATGLREFPLSTVLAHELDHVSRLEPMMDASKIRTIGDMLKFKACLELRAIEVENVQRTFLNLDRRAHYNDISNTIEGIAKAIESNPDLKEALEAQGAQHQFVRQLAAVAMLNMGCVSGDVIKHKQEAIKNTIDKLNQRLGTKIEAPDPSGLGLDQTIPSADPEPPSRTPPVPPAEQESGIKFG